MLLVGAGAGAVCIALWRVMFGIYSTFVGLSEGLAKYGFLALATAIVAGIRLRPCDVYALKLSHFWGMYTRARFTINPDKVYRIAMTKLNTSAAILEVMGAPLTGTDVRYDMKLLAVGITMASGPDQRLFLVGDAQEYKVGGGLISELRDPIVKAMAAEESDYLDERMQRMNVGSLRRLSKGSRKR
ncbi:hypothetical protein ABZP36_016683 [Zizania latifolia]